MRRAGNVAIAVGLGYVLGRKRKLKPALLLAVAAATGHLGKGPLGRMLAGGGGADGGGRGGGSGDGGSGAGGTGALGRLGGAGRSAARAALGKPVELLADRLNERAEAVRQGGRSGSASQGSEQRGGGSDSSDGRSDESGGQR